jgi:hypothetical protein
MPVVEREVATAMPNAASSAASRLPPGAIAVQTYAELDLFAQAFAQGKLNLLVLVGPPGVQKSRSLHNAVGRRACWVEGTASAFGLYCQAYASRDQTMVIDDVDGLLSDRAAVRLLKCLCQTQRRKHLGWLSDAPTLRRLQIPTSFVTTSRVAIIANELAPRSINLSAVLDRGHLLVFTPPPAEVHQRVGTWFWDQAVFDFVAGHLHLARQLSMRDYCLAWELKEAGLDWQTWLLRRWSVDSKLLEVARLKADSSYVTEEERAKAFIAQEFGCRASYFRIARQLRRPGSVPPLRLTARTPPIMATHDEILDLLRRRFGNWGHE